MSSVFDEFSEHGHSTEITKQFDRNRKSAEAALTSLTVKKTSKQTNQYTNIQLITTSRTHTHIGTKLCTHAHWPISFARLILLIVFLKKDKLLKSTVGVGSSF